MARLQILELPAGPDDDRPPFILVIDEASDEVAASLNAPDGTLREGLAEEIRSQGVLIFRETVEIPANDTTAYRDASPSEAPETFDAELAALVLETLGIEMEPGGISCGEVLFGACRELQKSEAARAHLRRERKEARMWARHGYEIGQKHCGWSDHGVAPDWLTEGWPPHIDSCEHLKRAAELDEALSRVRNLSTEPEVMNADQERPDVWKHGYHCGVLAARSATRPRGEETRKP
jgi:hypothetical protein